MIQILHDTKIPFMSYRRYFYMFSGAVLLATIIWLAVHGGPRYSVDFTGGTLVQLQTAKVMHPDDVRKALDAAGYKGYELQAAGKGDELLIRLATQEQSIDPVTHKPTDVFAKVRDALLKADPASDPKLRHLEAVGPKVGGELRHKALWAVLFSLGGILLYVGIRYEFKFAVGAVISLFHDVFAAFGVILFAHREVSLTVIAALLTLAGYSINDTIVIFDRIREDLKLGVRGTFKELINQALNQTLSRTIITSGTVFLATVSLYIFGGGAINDFAFTFLVGIITGTYSSIYIASFLVLLMHKGQRPKMGSQVAMTSNAAEVASSSRA